VAFDHSKKLMDINAMEEYQCVDSAVAKKYGSFVKAIAISNREYQHRYDKLSLSRAMRKPPLSGRIFPGYLTVRNLGKVNQYETWIPDHAFEGTYELVK
jgi:hypothetical protein